MIQSRLPGSPDTALSHLDLRENQSIGINQIRTKVASGLFALILQTNPVFSGEPITVATNSNSAPSASVPTADKGGGQVVDTPYGPLSFVEIQKHPKKDEILSGLKPSKQAKFNEWEQQAVIEKKKEKIDYQQAVIKEVEKIDVDTQAVIKEVEKIDVDTQAVIKDIIQKTPALIQVFENNIKSGKKLSEKDKELLKYIKDLGKPTEYMSRIEKLLNNPRNFA